MDFQFIDEGINAVVIDNFYTQEQLDKIMLELKWLTRKEIMRGEEDLNTAENEYGSLAKKSGVFLENVFINWKHSALISCAVEQLETKEFHHGLISHNQLYKVLFYCNHRSHLLSYYQNADYYEPHVDSSVFTILNYFTTEPKQWEGGEMILKSYTQPDKEAVIEIKNNRVIVITSNTFHSVNKIQSNLKEKYSGHGRYCNAIFMHKVDDKQWIPDGNGGGRYVERRDVGIHTFNQKKQK